LLIIDSLGRKWTLGLDFIGAGVFCFLAQICNSRTVYLTITMFGVRSFISGVFNIAYLYTSEVRSQIENSEVLVVVVVVVVVAEAWSLSACVGIADDSTVNRCWYM